MCRRFLWGLLGITGAAYMGSAGLAGVLFYYFKPSSGGDCSFNVSIICLTLFLGCIVTAVSMSPFVSLCNTPPLPGHATAFAGIPKISQPMGQIELNVGLGAVSTFSSFSATI